MVGYGVLYECPLNIANDSWMFDSVVIYGIQWDITYRARCTAR